METMLPEFLHVENTVCPLYLKVGFDGHKTLVIIFLLPVS